MSIYDNNKKRKADKTKNRKTEVVRENSSQDKAGKGNLAAKIVVIALIVMMGSFFLLSNLAYLLN